MKTSILILSIICCSLLWSCQNPQSDQQAKNTETASEKDNLNKTKRLAWVTNLRTTAKMIVLPFFLPIIKTPHYQAFRFLLLRN